MWMPTPAQRLSKKFCIGFLSEQALRDDLLVLGGARGPRERARRRRLGDGVRPPAAAALVDDAALLVVLPLASCGLLALALLRVVRAVLGRGRRRRRGVGVDAALVLAQIGRAHV